MTRCFVLRAPDVRKTLRSDKYPLSFVLCLIAQVHEIKNGSSVLMTKFSVAWKHDHGGEAKAWCFWIPEAI